MACRGIYPSLVYHSVSRRGSTAYHESISSDCASLVALSTELSRRTCGSTIITGSCDCSGPTPTSALRLTPGRELKTSSIGTEKSGPYLVSTRCDFRPQYQ